MTDVPPCFMEFTRPPKKNFYLQAAFPGRLEPGI